MDKEKIHSGDIEPQSGYHYLIVNGQAADRFDSIQKALAARDVFLEAVIGAEAQQKVQDCIGRSGPYMNPID